MIAKEITTNDVLPLKLEDNCAQAMTMMSIYHVADLPVVENDKLLGIISEDEVTTSSPDKLVSTFSLSKSYAFVYNDEHIFEILGKLAENKITVIPVVDREEKYVGLITQEELIKYYATRFSFKEPGSILVLKIHKTDYSLSEISRVIEMEGGALLSSFITTDEDTSTLLVTLKINQLDLSKIIQALNRYEYEIHATFSEDNYIDDLKSRYDLLMTYLNV